MTEWWTSNPGLCAHTSETSRPSNKPIRLSTRTYSS